jgi:hypothetical protein
MAHPVAVHTEGSGSDAVDGYSQHIDDLPNELLDYIFSFLDVRPPSSWKLYDEPEFAITSNAEAPLKAASCVSRRWRAAVLPRLYQHVCLIVKSGEFTPRPIMNDEVQPLLDFIRERELVHWVQSFTICISEKKLYDNTGGSYKLHDFSGFWHTVFDAINPLTLTIVAPPEALGSLTSCHVYSEDAWAFSMPYHMLQLSRHDKTLAPPPSKVAFDQTTRSSPSQLFTPLHSALFTIRPWSDLLLNEGSFIKSYSSYEYFLKHPPSILSDLVGADIPLNKPLLPSTIRNFSYIAMFPSSPHFQQLTNHFPRLDKLYVQFVPRNDILNDKDAIGHSDTRDMWMERNSCYLTLMREIFSAPSAGNYRYLREFESGDAADQDAWAQAVDYVENIGDSIWKVESDGVFVKDMKVWRELMEDTKANGIGGAESSLLSVFSSLSPHQ